MRKRAFGHGWYQRRAAETSGGDETAWNLHDWNWDSQNFTATPKKGIVAAAKPCRAAKRCRVEGCRRELSDLSAYHQKCRICDIHIKAPSFMRAGLKQRFCQRCGRCHELDAFEGSKRSCIAQLAKHNARRRRQQGTTAASDDLSALSLDLATAQSNVLESLNSRTHSLHVPMSQALPPGFSYQGLMGPDVALGIPIGVQGNMQAHTSAAMPLMMSSMQAPPTTSMVSSMEQALMQMGHPSAAGQLESPQESITPEFADDKPGPIQQQPVTAASAVAAGLPAAAAYQANSLVVRLSVKLFNCTPGDLPQGLREQLCNWLCATPAGAEGYIRPGCLHLTMQVHVDAAAEVAEGVMPVVESLLEQPGELWRTHRMLLQRDAEVALVHDGQLQSVAVALSAQQPGNTQPLIREVLPKVVVCQEGAHQDIAVQVTGVGLASADTTILARCHGHYLEVQVEGEQSEGDKSLLSLRLRGPAAPGLVWVETQHGVMLSPATPLLILPAGLHDLAADVLRIVSSPAKQEASADSQRKCCDGFLADLGLVISQAGALPGPAGSTLEHPAEQLTCAAAQPGPPVTATLVTRTARHLLAFACDAGAPALAHFLLPSASVGCRSAAEVVAAVDGVEAQGGSTLLHRAARSGSGPLLRGLLAWGSTNGYRWKADARDANGLTPLHFTAIVPDADLAVHLLLACGCSPRVWFTAAADDGLTPAHFAARVGRNDLNERMLLLAQEAQPGSLPIKPGCGCTCGDACACSRSGICRCAAASEGPSCGGSGGHSSDAGAVSSGGQSSAGGCCGSTGSCGGTVVYADSVPSACSSSDGALAPAGNRPMSACCVGVSL
ncbi:hypothetical protein COCSUDRAFT_65460 [Coccomyxa subellipsoidea C-169]|uniref:SBP-type domain-containing protein n=1 Tax=Coccomyxa subellipsoidea (strain C-169) TaxID=574566 RepID=I0Z1X9_COCSC|nr:hypothetical protein COCSUDRAFT_65460 [Coccomyxa subellipsoidea C-169]EIE24648.1 hypothetical protein COCSUDRAFT_65460 [Coccomyxa subellipsoidea C-169]|eukprot:XP_005649192.1 hypothetical protein COCSUDRAFT_65460 [Coccomyxa subellipsoidea C-169]